MYKDIVLPITGGTGDMSALNKALDLAAAHGAHLTVLEMVNLPLPASSPWALMPDLSMSDVYRELREQGLEHVAALRERLKTESVSTDVQLAEAFFTEPAQLAAHLAHYGDLTVLSGGLGDTKDGDIAHRYFASLLLNSGRPVLVIPPRCKTTMPPKKVVVAWRPTRECARAVHEALPLLQGADSVDLLVVDPTTGEQGEGEEPGAEIAAHLARHGVKVNVQVRQALDNRVGAVLLEHARECHANLLVVGGYGHSRLREWALGGVTRELWVEAPIPVFYSH